MKKILLTFFFCVSAFAFTVFGQSPKIFETYKADFSAGVAKDWVAVAGAWEVKDNPVIGDPKQYASAGGEKFWSYYNGASFENYEASATLYPQWGNPFGIVFNMTDEQNYYVLELSGKRKYAWIWQVEGGVFVNDGYKWEAKPTDAGNFYLHRDTIKNNPWIETDVDPSNYFNVVIKCDVDGVTTISVNGGVVFEGLEDVGSKGKIGVWANWCPTFLKSLEVKSLSTVSSKTISNSSISMFPNPVVDNLNLSTTVEKVEVFNLAGQKVHEAQNTNAVSMKGLHSGLYIVKLNGTETRKIMVK